MQTTILGTHDTYDTYILEGNKLERLNPFGRLCDNTQWPLNRAPGSASRNARPVLGKCAVSAMCYFGDVCYFYAMGEEGVRAVS